MFHHRVRGVSIEVYDLYEEMFAIINALEGDRIDYAVCGGLAVAIHGLVRATRDIDLLIEREDLDRVLAAARRCGFNLEGGMLPMGAGEPVPRDIFRISKVIEKDLVTLDLLIVNQLLQQAWDAREYYDWQGRRLQALSPVGLYVTKCLPGDQRIFSTFKHWDSGPMIPLPRMKPRDVDMSPEAIDLRLRQVSDLTRLCLSLGTAKRLGTVKEIRERERLAELARSAATAELRIESASDKQAANDKHAEQKDTL